MVAKQYRHAGEAARVCDCQTGEAIAVAVAHRQGNGVSAGSDDLLFLLGLEGRLLNQLASNFFRK
jgi:hypothetical protein